MNFFDRIGRAVKGAVNDVGNAVASGNILSTLGLGAAAFATGGSALVLPAVASAFGLGKKNQADAAETTRQMDWAQGEAKRIRQRYDEDVALQQRLIPPDMADEILKKARSAEVLRQQSRSGRAGSFLTGPGGSLANASLLTDGSGGRRTYW